MKTNRAPVVAIPVMLRAVILGAAILGAAGPLAAQQSAPAVTATPNRQMQPTATGRTQAPPAAPMAPLPAPRPGPSSAWSRGARPSPTAWAGTSARWSWCRPAC